MYLKRCHSLARAGGRDVMDLSAASALEDTASSLRDTIEARWARLRRKPLQEVVLPSDDASCRRWLCLQHARAMAPKDSNLLRNPMAETVDLGFLRFVRVGVALDTVSKALAEVLQPRVEDWYESQLTVEASAQTARALQDDMAVAVEQQQQQGLVARLQLAVDAALVHALAAVDAEVARRGGTLHGGTPKAVAKSKGVQRCTPEGQKLAKKEKPWDEWVQAIRTRANRRDGNVALQVLDWQEVEPSDRHFVRLQGCLRKPIQLRCRNEAWVDELVAVACAAFATHVNESSDCRALVTLDVALLAPDDDSSSTTTSGSGSSGGAGEGKEGGEAEEEVEEEAGDPPTLHCDGTCAACKRLPPRQGKCDPTSPDSGVCAVCRGWAKAIAVKHRKKAPDDNSWRNCVPHQWSAQDREVLGCSGGGCFVTVRSHNRTHTHTHTARSSCLGGCQGVHGCWLCPCHLCCGD